MNVISEDVDVKLTSAIKAKLMELDCHVDDELPIYIMLMITNQRSRSQMEKDLKLFLNPQTEKFVEWLYQVICKLKEVKITNPEIRNSVKELQRRALHELDSKKTDENSTSHTDETNLVNNNESNRVNLLTDYLSVKSSQLLGTLNRETGKSSKKEESIKRSPKTKGTCFSKQIQVLQHINMTDKAQGLKESEDKNDKVSRRTLYFKKAKLNRNQSKKLGVGKIPSIIIPKDRSLTESPKKDDSTTDIIQKSVLSVVQVAERKPKSVTNQPPKALLLKAVRDAERSVAQFPVDVKDEEDSNIKLEISDDEIDCEISESLSSLDSVITREHIPIKNMVSNARKHSPVVYNKNEVKDSSIEYNVKKANTRKHSPIMISQKRKHSPIIFDNAKIYGCKNHNESQAFCKYGDKCKLDLCLYLHKQKKRKF